MAKAKNPAPLKKESSEYTAKDLNRAKPALRDLGLSLLARENAIREQAQQEITRLTKPVMDKMERELAIIARQKLTVVRELKA